MKEFSRRGPLSKIVFSGVRVKLLFGLDKYSHYSYKYRTTTASWRYMNMINKVYAGQWKMIPGLPAACQAWPAS